MSSVTPGADDDPRLKILIQEDKAKRPCSVSIKSVYWGQEWARSQPLERFRGQLTSVGRAGTLKRYKIKWVGGDEPEAGAGADLIKKEFDFQIEDGDEGEPAATLLPPRGTRRPRPAAEPEGSENGLSRETTSGSDNDESDLDDDSRPPPATAEAHGVVWTHWRLVGAHCGLARHPHEPALRRPRRARGQVLLPLGRQGRHPAAVLHLQAEDLVPLHHLWRGLPAAPAAGARQSPPVHVPRAAPRSRADWAHHPRASGPPHQPPLSPGLTLPAPASSSSPPTHLILYLLRVPARPTDVSWPRKRSRGCERAHSWPQYTDLMDTEQGRFALSSWIRILSRGSSSAPGVTLDIAVREAMMRKTKSRTEL